MRGVPHDETDLVLRRSKKLTGGQCRGLQPGEPRYTMIWIRHTLRLELLTVGLALGAACDLQMRNLGEEPGGDATGTDKPCTPGDTLERDCTSCTCSDEGEWECPAIACPRDLLPICTEDTPNDPLDITDAYIAIGDTLHVTFAYEGGCAEHVFGLCQQEFWEESLPVQTGLRIIHDAMEDTCEAYPTVEMDFDLTPLASLHREAYDSSPPWPIDINLQGWDERLRYTYEVLPNITACTDVGGIFKPWPGDFSLCRDEEIAIARVVDGIDGGVCCLPPPWFPPGDCQLPFDAGPCEAIFRVYAFVDGQCIEQEYGGCEGNDNRFFTLEECMATCEGRPTFNRCPAGRIEQEICLACGNSGGCGHSEVVCALPCETSEDCETTSGLSLRCLDEVCEVGPCI